MKTPNSKNGNQQAKVSSKTENHYPPQQKVEAAAERVGARSDKQPPSLSRNLPPDGGQTTISPPANVKTDDLIPPTVLASGIDTLYLTMNITWSNGDFFKCLSELKDTAIEEEEDQQITLKDEVTQNEWVFNVRPHGVKRYEWLIYNNEYTIKIGNWLKPKTIPSVIVEIRSETLWSHGFQKAVNNITHLLEQKMAFIHNIKPSRVDICVDILLPEELWSMDLLNYKVTRATYTSPHLVYKMLTGITTGKGAIKSRLYDKPLEIKQKKDKEWMYDIWGLPQVPQHAKIIRVEFQIMREILKKLGIDEIIDLLNKVQNLWGYCTQNWLKFQSRPGKHNTQRKTLEWWKTVQNGFLGFQNPNPLVRSNACKANLKQMGYQIYGLFTSYCALGRGIDEPPLEPVHIGKVIRKIMKDLYFEGKDKATVIEDVEKKHAEFLRIKPNTEEVKNDRMENAYPNLPYTPGQKKPSP